MAYFNSEEDLSVVNIPNNFSIWQIFSHLSSSFPDGLCTFIKPSPRWFFCAVLRRTRPKISLFWKQAQHTNGRPKKHGDIFQSAHKGAHSQPWVRDKTAWVCVADSVDDDGPREQGGWLSLPHEDLGKSRKILACPKTVKLTYPVERLTPSPSPGRWQQGLTPLRICNHGLDLTCTSNHIVAHGKT